jgi:hypothetical protein
MGTFGTLMGTSGTFMGIFRASMGTFGMKPASVFRLTGLFQEVRLLRLSLSRPRGSITLGAGRVGRSNPILAPGMGSGMRNSMLSAIGGTNIVDTILNWSDGKDSRNTSRRSGRILRNSTRPSKGSANTNRSEGSTYNWSCDFSWTSRRRSIHGKSTISMNIGSLGRWKRESSERTRR